MSPAWRRLAAAKRIATALQSIFVAELCLGFPLFVFCQCELAGLPRERTLRFRSGLVLLHWYRRQKTVTSAVGCWLFSVRFRRSIGRLWDLNIRGHFKLTSPKSVGAKFLPALTEVSPWPKSWSGVMGAFNMMAVRQVPDMRHNPVVEKER